MTMPIQFDTLKYAKRLTEAGIPPDHAEAQAQALSDVLADTIVVPGDLILLKVDVLARIELLRQELTASIELLRQETLAKFELLRQETLAKFELARQELDALEQRINGKFKTLHWVLGAMLVLHIATLAKLFSM
ncbi:DUF1640 domain-containing protein [Rugamonas sp. CCM 8940]|uniref:DUF1640 domain-containing protein n=1 Tax=Rugamonas sp. CCM 8940 TaxID=2765359 RepID=UPI0018F55B0C|nr:DUF1640 domain-containing protein [Rugamonas sp. CCM 8940]MBJ7309851.1 DUF1640 domain-containing protein [Rugamonas sp. CCM 8940]